MNHLREGGCQCGAVRYRATSLRQDAHICHCRMCQKAVGGAFAALAASGCMTRTANAPRMAARGGFADAPDGDTGFFAQKTALGMRIPLLGGARHHAGQHIELALGRQVQRLGFGVGSGQEVVAG